MDQDDFDYGELPREWWIETALQCGATEKHARFAAAKHRGATNTDAARAAGFGAGSDASVRSEGYRLARSNRIMSLLALAAAKAGGGYDGTLTLTESRQILTNLARGSDPALKIKSIEALNKLDRDERAARGDGDVPQDLAEVARLILADAGIWGAPWMLEMWIADGHGDVTSAPHWPLLAPFIKNRCPELWTRYRQPLLTRAEHFKTERECGFLAAFDAAGEQPEPSDAEFRAAIGKAAVVTPRVNGAALTTGISGSLVETTDQVEANADAAA